MHQGGDTTAILHVGVPLDGGKSPFADRRPRTSRLSRLLRQAHPRRGRNSDQLLAARKFVRATIVKNSLLHHGFSRHAPSTAVDPIQALGVWPTAYWTGALGTHSGPQDRRHHT
jgi:hypothetical protein